MKEFMFLFVGTDYESADLSPETIQVQMEKWFAWVDKLQKEDIYVEGRALVTAAKRVTDKDLTATDGPFVETKELVGGYFIVKAKDMDHAIQLAEDYPDYDYGGSVEIREIMVF